MEKKIGGILLFILGVTGLIAAQMYILEAIGPSSTYYIKDSHSLEIIVFGILGLFLVFAGIRMIRNNRSTT
jgi:hypothetical protein